MFTVVSQPFRRHRQAVVSEMPAFSQNLCRLKMGLPSIWKFDSVFTTRDYESHSISPTRGFALRRNACSSKDNHVRGEVLAGSVMTLLTLADAS
jgi:hypothetical protein